ncbi:MAG TPA: TSUP family transporter [Anaeromyxobacteraceae bacterium]|nr:TSUP family transporter [Anaeromyxobacteraceae bacterium]
MDLPLLHLALLALVAFVAGIVDAVAGGGGLLTVPALVTAGLPPHLALATNKGQSVFGAAAALLRFARAGMVDAARARVAFPAGLVGSLLGAAAVLRVRPEVLRPVVLALLVGAAAFVGLRRGPPRVAARVSARRAPLAAALIALVIGAYDGFFGPGTGTLLIVAFASLLGDGLARASGEAKAVNFASNLAAVLLFAARGVVLWRVALPMAAAQFAGGMLGAHLAVRRGDAFVRRVVLLVVVALCVKLGRDLLVAR